MKSFSELHINPKIFQAIDACGYTTPTEIQAKSIPVILEGRDVIGATETGSGKTAAFVLPTLHLLAESNKKQHKPRVLILTPTRELAHQINTAINKYGKFSRPNTASIIGGASYREQERMLSRSPEIIVATPGRLIDHVKNNRIDLSMIEMFILDEADRMLDMGFIDDVKLIAKSTPKTKQTLLFTATLNKKLISSVGHLLQDPVVIDLSKPKMVPTQIKQQLFIANNQQAKISFLEKLLGGDTVFKGIIFAATKIGADRIADHLRTQGHNALALHGDLKQRVRKKSLERFTAGKVEYLVATDIASRGIDVQDITHVINFDLPRCSDDYIHRVGRTGRAGRDGIAITLATKDERRYISSIERHAGTKLQVIDHNGEPSNDVYVEERAPQEKKRRYGDRKQNAGGGRSYGYSDRKQNASGDRPYAQGDRKPSGERSYSYGDRKQNAGGERTYSQGDRKQNAGGDRSYSQGDRKQSASGDRSYSYGDRKQTEGNDRSARYGDRKQNSNGDKPFSYGDRKPKRAGKTFRIDR